MAARSQRWKRGWCHYKRATEGPCGDGTVLFGIFSMVVDANPTRMIKLYRTKYTYMHTHTYKYNWRNKISRLQQCRYPGYDIILFCGKMLTLG